MGKRGPEKEYEYRIAARLDDEAMTMLEHLERTYEESRSAVIRQAIATLHEIATKRASQRPQIHTHSQKR